jgi:translation initiation factor 3 subunit J
LKAIVTAKPTTKADFATLSTQIMSTIISPHTDNALYAAFVEQLAKDLCEGLTAVQTRKVSSALSVLGNTKQQEERDKASGKKKVCPLSQIRKRSIMGADDRLLLNPNWQLDPRLLARQMIWRLTMMFWRMTISCDPHMLRCS